MRKLVLRGIRARKLRTVLTATAVMLGVAMIVGTYVYSDTIDRAFFQLFSDASKGADAVVAGKQSVSSTSYGPPPTLSEDLARKIGRLDGVKAVEGQIWDIAAVVGRDGKPVKTGGAPTFALSYMNPPFQALKVVKGRPPSDPSEAAVDEATAESEGFKVGQQITVATDRPKRKFKLTGLVEFGNASSGGATYVVFSRKTAQQLLNKQGKLDYISVAASSGVTPAQLVARIRPLLPRDAQVKTASQQVDDNSARLRNQLKFLTYGLLAFGFISVFVGAFIIFNTFSITVAQRRVEFALLRTLGASRRQILSSVIAEALLIGVVSSVIGIGFGLLFAEGVKELFAALEVKLPSTALVLEGRTVVIALIVGIFVTLCSALAPALRATRVAPLEALREGRGSRSTRRQLISRALALLLSLGGAALIVFGLTGGGLDGQTRLGMSAGGVILLVIGVALISPIVVPPIARIAGWPLERVTSLIGKLARENAQRNPGRTAITAAALMIGLSLVLFVTIFANGLRVSADQIIDRSLAGDLAIYSQDGFTPIPAAVGPATARVEGVAEAVPFKMDSSQFGRKANAMANGIDPTRITDVYNFDWVKGSDRTLYRLGRSGVLVEENLAEGTGLRVGKRVTVVAPSGRRATLTVRGIYKDSAILPGYSIPMSAFDRIFSQRRLAVVYATFAQGVNTHAVQKQVERALTQFPEAIVRSQRELKEESSDRINQVLVLFYALLAMSLLVSLFGIVNTLTLSIYERTRELGLLRAVGMTRRGVRRMVRYESVITAAIGATLGLLLGTFFAAVVTQSLADEGIVFDMPWLQLTALLVLALLAGVLAAIPPARRASRLNVLESIAYE